MKTMTTKNIFKATVLASFIMILTIVLAEAEVQVPTERILLVDFGATEAENTFGSLEWNIVIKSSNTEYTSAGPGGLTKVSNSDPLANYQGVTGPLTVFEAGDEIIVTWYNNTGKTVSMWQPLISFEDIDTPNATEGEPQWHVMKDINGEPTINYMYAGDTRQSIYVITSENSIVGEAAPTQGSHSFINISINDSKTGIVCDKIELVRAADSKPSQVSNLTAVANPENPDSRINLNWTASQGKVDHYRIYRDGAWIGKTIDSHYTDSNLESLTAYTYTVQAFRNPENMSEMSAEIIGTTTALQRGSHLIDPQNDLKYIGAFKFPSARSTSGSKWSYRRGGIAYYPSGDPLTVDGDSDSPGSLYAFGFRPDVKVAEISIPAPVITRNHQDLPRSQTLQNFHDIQPSNNPGTASVGSSGLVYLPIKNSFYFTFNDNYNVTYQKKVSHGAFSFDFSEIQGLWFVGDKDEHTQPRYYAYNKFLADIPPEWASENGISEQVLLSGGYRSGPTPQGPGLVAVRPWEEDGSAPSQDAELQITTLLEYDIEEGGQTLNGFIDNDGWAGTAWLTAGTKSAVVITGEKAYGESFYGFNDGSVATDVIHAVPKISLPSNAGSKGGKARSYRGMMLFYDPDDLAQVAQGRLAANQPQPYAVLELDRYMFRENLGNPTMSEWIGSATFDRARGLLYVVEQGAFRDGEPEDIIHVFKLDTPVMHSIQSSGNSGGKIWPIGTVNIREGEDQIFVVSPEPGYQVKDVVIDNVSQGTLAQYTFIDIQESHTIQAVFEELSCIVSGTVQDSDGNRIADVVLQGLPENPMTDMTGIYQTVVPGGWSGNVSPQKSGYKFTPEAHEYTNVLHDLTEQNFHGTALASYYNFEEFGGSWHDASPSKQGDPAWTAAAANVLAWSGWGTPAYNTAQEISKQLDDNCDSETGVIKYGWRWWLNGEQPTDAVTSGSNLEHTGSGGYWPQYHFSDFFHESWAEFSGAEWRQGAHLLPTIADYLHRGSGVAITASGNEDMKFAVWGYQLDDDGNYTGLWVTDSTDSFGGMSLLSVSLLGDLWYLGQSRQNQWVLAGIEAFDRYRELGAVPEPGTLLLAGSGLIAIIALKRKSSKNHTTSLYKSN